MAKFSEKYETMVVYSVKNGEEQVTALKDKLSAFIGNGAELLNINEWGKRRLAYQINYETDGYYVLYSFDCKPDFPDKLERMLGITEGILRFLTVVRNDAPVGQKPADNPETTTNNESNAAEVANESAESSV